MHPARVRRALLVTIGLTAVVAGVALGVVQLVGGATATGSASGGSTSDSSMSEPTVPTCVSIGVNLPAGRFPAEGVSAERVVRLFRADRDGTARVLVPQSFVLTSAPAPDGSINLSVLVRSGPGDDDRHVAEINGANAERSLSAAVLYDVDSTAVLDECRTPPH